MALQIGSEASVVPTVRDQYANAPAILSMIESQLNVAGYSAISDEDIVRAREIFKLNTEVFPNSANTWDSYAESFFMLEDYARAKALYQRALDADPEFSNATRMLNRIADETEGTAAN